MKYVPFGVLATVMMLFTKRKNHKDSHALNGTDTRNNGAAPVDYTS